MQAGMVSGGHHPTCQMTVLNDKPHLNESGDLKALCHHAAMLKQITSFSTAFREILSVSRQIRGGTILVVQSIMQT